MSCATTAELIETQFATLSQVGPGNMYYIECRYPQGKGHLRAFGRLKKHCKAQDSGGLRKLG